jgi:hypothetical protein
MSLDRWLFNSPNEPFTVRVSQPSLNGGFVNIDQEQTLLSMVQKGKSIEEVV